MWSRVVNVVSVFHNPAASASFDALILLRKAQLYNRTTNPRPVEFTLDVVQPPQGMTNQQQMAIQTILQQQMLDKMRAKGGEVPSDPSKIPRAKMEPPLVVSWMTNEVASGSIADVEAIISRMREQQWASKDAKEETPGVITDAVRRFKSWWSFYDR